MKKIMLLIVLCSWFSQAQEHAWVYFKDKPNASSFLLDPSLMLTQKALDRRNKQNISPNEQDVPLYTSYVLSVANSEGITVKARSKWLNAVHVIGTETNIRSLANIEGVNYIEFANKSIGEVAPSIINTKEKFPKIQNQQVLNDYQYGSAENQTTMLEIDVFHSSGYDGKGLEIAIFDGGFFGVNNAGGFSHLLDANLDNGEILGGYDYVNSSSDFYVQTGSTHGTQVLSTMGVVIDTEFVGTAPKASFYLFVTEDISNESPLEESFWVQAAEKADSLGVDILNTSLGYNQFDESKYNYTYADMDGNTTFISRGATIAAQKGMVVVNSAGNSGHTAWKYITAPADAHGVIAVGAVNANESISFFSSFGPTSDGRIKPETLAQGGSVYVVDENNTIKTTNGTSFSGPIIAGVTACLWQAFPEKTSLEIREMVLNNSEEYLNPTGQRGYGVLKVGNLLQTLSSDVLDEQKDFSVNFNQEISVIEFDILQSEQEILEVKLISPLGKEIGSKKISRTENEFDISEYVSGIYYMIYTYKGESKFKSLYKAN